jgi:hypothetical protein
MRCATDAWPDRAPGHYRPVASHSFGMHGMVRCNACWRTAVASNWLCLPFRVTTLQYRGRVTDFRGKPETTRGCGLSVQPPGNLWRWAESAANPSQNSACIARNREKNSEYPAPLAAPHASRGGRSPAIGDPCQALTSHLGAKNRESPSAHQGTGLPPTVDLAGGRFMPTMRAGSISPQFESGSEVRRVLPPRP